MKYARLKSKIKIFRKSMYAKAKKYARKGAKYLRKRYTAKPGGRKATGGVRVGKMARDIMYLKSVLNPEKKRTEESVINTDPFGAVPLGQVNGNNDGSYVKEVTPYITTGPAFNQRTGASVKLHSTVWNFQITQQPSCVNTIKCVMEWWYLPEQPYSNLETFRRAKYQVNPFITPLGSAPRDYNCQYNPDNYKIGKCIARRYVTVKNDDITGQKTLVNLKVPILYNKGKGIHLRWDKDSTTLTGGQICLIIRCDRGNMSTGLTPTPSTLSGIQDVAPETGLNLQWNKVDYYYDN